MSDQNPELTPAEQLRDVIRQHRRKPVVAAAVGDVLNAVDTWVVDVERRVDLLAASQLRLYYNIEPHEAQLDTLAKFGDSARMVGLCRRPR